MDRQTDGIATASTALAMRALRSAVKTLHCRLGMNVVNAEAVVLRIT